MLGVSKTEFAPHAPSSPAMIALSLARFFNVDLSSYNTAGGTWYAEAMAWAADAGLFDGFSNLQHDMKIERGQLMVVIERAVKLAGIDASVTDEIVSFADADEMTDEEQHVFRLLYKLGIVRGKNDDIMDPRGVSTRAELAAILHRIKLYEQKAQ